MRGKLCVLRPFFLRCFENVLYGGQYTLIEIARKGFAARKLPIEINVVNNAIGVIFGHVSVAVRKNVFAE